MRARIVLLTALFVAGCGGATATQPAPTAAGASAGAPTPGVGATPAATKAAETAGGNGQPAAIRASGAKIRVANLYQDGSATPAPIDVYGDFTAAGAPLMSVAYGTVSDWFDPGIIDDQRNAEITFFPSGRHTADDLLIDQGETLKGTERITMIVGRGENQKSDGTYYGQIEVGFENSTLNPLPTSKPGQSLVELDPLALDAWPGAGATAQDGYLYLSAGKGCLKAVGTEDDSGIGVQPLSAGRGSARFSIPAGAQTLTLHASDACTDPSPYPGIAVNIAAGQASRVLVFSSDGKTLRTLLVPFGG